MNTIYDIYNSYNRKYGDGNNTYVYNPLFYKIEQRILQAYEYFGENNVPDNLDDIIYNGEDYIFENLNTHDYKLLCNKIQQLFGQYIIKYDIVYDKGETNKNMFYLEINDASLLKNKQFIHLLQFFNYKIREYKSKHKIVLIEPIYSKCATPISPVLYHFTTKDKVKDILLKGLRPKRLTGTNTLERIYLYQPSICYNIKNDDKVISFIKTIFGHIPNNLAILRIDYHELTSYGNRSLFLYQDTAMPFDEAVFIQHSIPAKYISEIYVKGLTK